MVILSAYGNGPDQFRKWTLVSDESVKLGRAPLAGWAIPWDAHISREHVELTWTGEELQVQCLATARNPLIYRDCEQRNLALAVGEEFRIGDTRFCLSAESCPAHEDQLIERTFSPQQLKSVQVSDPEVWIDHLARLPEVITAARTSDELAAKLVEITLAAIRRATVVGVVQHPEGDSDADIVVCGHWASNQATDLKQFQPSRRLVEKALATKESVLHLWKTHDGDSFTRAFDFDWAFCTPVTNPGGEGWCIYVTGWLGGFAPTRVPTEEQNLQGDMRFVQVLAQFLGALLEGRQLRSRETRIGEFLPTVVMETLRRQDAAERLKPRTAEVSVLFCDVRGFSRKAEQCRHHLEELLDRVSSALEVMTGAIAQHGGIIADFQGDAALGFWGWPLPLDEGPAEACRAALDILTTFSSGASRPDDPFGDFRVGVGIAHGTAIAGKIGTDHQSKFGVFGPIVNLGARLEGMTKHLRAPILVDEPTAAFVRDHLSRKEARVRRLARIQPAGLDEALWVSELLPPLSVDDSVSDDAIAQFEAAADAFVSGEWPRALELLYKLPANDRVKEFLILHILQHQSQPPVGWKGILAFSTK